MGYGYHRPSNLAEALRMASEIPGARFIAGGTDLLVQMGDGRPDPAALISLRRVPELGGVESSDRVRIGAAVPLSDLQVHPVVVEGYPALVDSIVSLGSRQIRNVATLGGNLCNASPAADTAPPLLIYGTSVELTSEDGSREIALDEFLRGPGETALLPGEILSAILIEQPAEGARSMFLRKGRVAMDLPIASVAALAERQGHRPGVVRLAAGAVAPVPFRLHRTERVLQGSSLDADVISLAVETARDEVSPITDIRASEDYRRHLTGVFVGRALEHLAGEGWWPVA